nr:hypothetical protein [Marinicella sp. W31]MDC2877852.1 hypothetical protein [Marinicella sp. W31]
MRDFYLRFADHAEAHSVLVTAGADVPDALEYRDSGLPKGMLIIKPVGADCDGLVYAPTGEIETYEDGFEYPVTDPVSGYHVNIRMAEDAVLPAGLAGFEVAPKPETPTERFS